MTEFFVPHDRSSFAERVRQRFEMLLRNRVITGISFADLGRWWSNFDGDEEQYLAAHLLDSLVYRTDEMLVSSSRHVLHMILPDVLESKRAKTWADLDQFRSMMMRGDRKLGLRVLAVQDKLQREDGSIEHAVAKSGSSLLRIFARATSVSNSLLIAPGQIAAQGSGVRSLVILDDCLGTGTQFMRFARAYKLAEEARRRHVIYIPFVAHHKGIATLQGSLDRVVLKPVETLGAGADFFAGSEKDPQVWRRDRVNQVSAAKELYSAALKRHGVAADQGPFGLNLSLAFGISTPNNSLKAFFTTEGTWSRLFVR